MANITNEFIIIRHTIIIFIKLDGFKRGLDKFLENGYLGIQQQKYGSHNFIHFLFLLSAVTLHHHATWVWEEDMGMIDIWLGAYCWKGRILLLLLLLMRCPTPVPRFMWISISNIRLEINCRHWYPPRHSMKQRQQNPAEPLTRTVLMWLIIMLIMWWMPFPKVCNVLHTSPLLLSPLNSSLTYLPKIESLMY